MKIARVLLLLWLWLWPHAALAFQQSLRSLSNGLTIISWPGDPSASRLVDAASSLLLEDSEVLLVPVEPGDRVRVIAEPGVHPLLGLATGQGELPDVITWDPAAGNELRLPAWSSARFVAARVSSAATLRVEVAARSETPLAWLDWDRAVGAALRGGAAPELPEGSAAARYWRGLAALLDNVAPAERGAAADLLQLCWLEQALRVRPLMGPYFAQQSQLEFDAPRELHAGERFDLDVPGVDVLRWQIRAWGDVRVRVREGEAVSRELSWSAPLAGSRPRTIRVVPPAASGHVSLEVLAGKISFEQTGWVQRREFYELLDEPVRERLQLAERSQQSSVAWVREAAAARARRGADPASLIRQAELAPPGDLRAWLLLEAARTERQSPAALALSDRALDAARSPLIEVLALQHRRDVTPPASAGPVPPPSLRSVPLTAMSGPASEQQLWLLALHGRDALVPGARPAWGAQLERWATLRSEDREVWNSVAGFWRSIPYRSVPPSPGALTSAEYVPLEPGVDCPLPGAPPGPLPPADKFDRWLFPLPGSTPLQAQLPAQHFAGLLFKPLAPEPLPESSVRLDGVSVPIHSGAGLSSELAVSAGAHALEVPGDAPPLAVRLSAGISAPCEQLRRVRTWTELADGARADFELPGVGSMSVARISLAPPGPPRSALAGTPTLAPEPDQELDVRVGGRRLIVWGRGARSGAGEIRIEAETTALSLSGRGVTVRVRVDLRRAADAPNPPEASPETTPSEPDPLRVDASPPPTDFESALVQLRELGRSLRAARGEAAVAELRGRRARLLDALGFRELALRDADPELLSERDRSWLPGETRSVIPVNLGAKVGPLPLPAVVAELAERRERLRITGCESFGAETEPAHELGADAESLLLGYCAEQNGLTLLAARAYEAIGRELPSGAALARAANLLADQSLDTGEPAFALRARLLVSRATALGEDTSGLLARLAPALEWVVPNAFEHATGFATVTLKAPPNQTPGTRVRRALVDAPDLASLIDGESAVQMVVKVETPAPLELELGCEDPNDLGCRPELLLDGTRFDCPHEPGSEQPCQMPLLAGEHRVELRLPSERALGWVKATVGGKLVPFRLSSRWVEVAAQTPAKLIVLGPTVVVLEARGSGAAGETLVWEGCEEAEPIRSFELPAGIDPGALRAGETTTLGTPLRIDLPIETRGPCTLRLGPRVGRALLRLSVARAQGLPKPRLASWEPPEPPPPPAPPRPEALLERAPEILPPFHDGLPLLLLGRSRLVASSRSLEDESPAGVQTPSSSYLELSALAARELIPARFWTFGQTGMRFRRGPPSLLGRWWLDLPATSSAPGMQLDTEGYWQSIGGHEALSLRSTGSLSALAELTPNLDLIPRAAYTIGREPRRPDDLSVTDADVYSSYRESHSHYLNLELKASWRPLVDALGKLLVSARARPDFGGLDRTGVGGSWLFMPLSGANALLELETETSYRVLGPDRSHSFLRQSAGLSVSWWRWFTGSERIRVFGRVDGGFDVPAGLSAGSVLTGQLGVEFSTSADRGLSDLSPATMPFLDFQERGRDAAAAPRAAGGAAPLGPPSGAAQ